MKNGKKGRLGTTAATLPLIRVSCHRLLMEFPLFFYDLCSDLFILGSVYVMPSFIAVMHLIFVCVASSSLVSSWKLSFPVYISAGYLYLYQPRITIPPSVIQRGSNIFLGAFGHSGMTHTTSP